MLNGFEYVKKTIDQRVDIEYLCTLHDLCIDGVESYQYVPGNYGVDALRPIKKGLYDEEYKNNFGFIRNKITCESLIELEEEKLICFNPLNQEDASKYLATYERKDYLYRSEVLKTHFFKKHGIDKVKQFCVRYYNEIQIANTEYEKLSAIAKFCRALEIFHLFYDGNQRTIVFLLLNKLLIENGFSPVILEDPYIFDGYHSIEELVEDIEQGMRNFEYYKR